MVNGQSVKSKVSTWYASYMKEEHTRVEGENDTRAAKYIRRLPLESPRQYFFLPIYGLARKEVTNFLPNNGLRYTVTYTVMRSVSFFFFFVFKD